MTRMVHLQGLIIQSLSLKVLYFSILCQAWEVQDIPESVRALKGSCVVIPCTVSYPGSPKPTENLVAIWKKSPEEEIFNTQISNDRMKLVGDIGQNNCSLEIKDVQPKDGGPLHFRIVVHGLDSYSFLNKVVSVKVQGLPDDPDLIVSTDLQAGVAVVALCVVKHTCPTHPPKITWTYNTTKSKVQHLAAKDAEWKLTSSITLIPEARQHGEKLTCKVKYWGGMQVETSVVLQVTYKPIILKNTTCTANSSWTSCQCFVDCNPPADIKWHFANNDVPSNSTEQRGTVTVGTLEGALHVSKTIICSATNPYGTAEHTITLPVKDKPIILNNTTCIGNSSGTFCRCFANSSPPADIEWHFADNKVPSSSIERQGSVSVGTLEGPLNAGETILCVATNIYGTVKWQITLPVKDKPIILNNTTCIANSSWTFCQCFVDSYPAADIKWHLSDSEVSSSSIERQGTMSVGTLEGALQAGGTILCTARNDYGTVSRLIIMPVKGVHLSLLVAVPLTAVLLVTALVFTCHKVRTCTNRNPKNKSSRHDGKFYPSDGALDPPLKSYTLQELSDRNVSDVEDEDEVSYENLMEQPEYGNMFQDEIYANHQRCS
ncbi:myelin-associated glycoprotein-like isoform X1 [Erpetoichthys calabaricus]|uniref:myelin-associated glycoprotein-like isoform X1 n=1 Tax=Erpetoichthys calabaricus TaxID=27687 RepID=UPI002234B322|nr:myelin-associated glycoprotein-like isoform X1 [Erpetoichthys calabaricus]